MKRVDNRTTAAVAAAVILIAGSAIFFGWRIGELSRTGWAGFAYFFQPHQEDIVDRIPALSVIFKSRGEVMVVLPDSPARDAGVQAGDAVLSLNELPTDRIEELKLLAERARPGDTIEYSIRHGDEEITREIELIATTDNRTQMISMIASLITGFGFLLVSLLLFTAGPRSQGAVIFFLLCVVGSMFFFFSAAFEFEMNDAQGIVPVGSQVNVVLIMMAYLVLAVAMMNLMLHFSLVFPRKSHLLQRAPEILWWLHLAPFAIPIGLLTTALLLKSSSKRFFWLLMVSATLLAIAAIIRLVLKRKSMENWKEVFRSSPLIGLGLLTITILYVLIVARWASGDAFIIAFLVPYILSFLGAIAWPLAYLLMTLGNFYRSYRASNFEERLQLRWPLWGAMVSLLSSMLLALVIIIGWVPDPPLALTYPTLYSSLGAVVKLAYLLIPLSFGLGIQKYGLMQVDTILKKTFVYGAVTTFVVITYFVMVGVFGVALVSWAGVENQVVTVAATLIVAALFVPVRSRVQNFVDTRFFKRERGYDDVRRSLARMTATSRDLDQFLTTATRTLSEALGVPRLAIFVREPSGSALVLQTSHGLQDRTDRRPEIVEGDPITQPGERIIDLTESTSPIGGTLELRYAVRLQTAEGVVGTVAVSDRPRDQLSDEDLEFLRGIADQLALGISSLQIRTDDLEVVQARQIQRSLLPAEIPQIRGIRIATAWIPARSVGGDYYDVLSLSDSKLGFCVGDVVGKGMPAALLMSGLQSAVRAIAPADGGTDVTVAGIRRVSAQNLTGGKFITFFYATIDTSRNLEFTNAGHNEPLLVQSGGEVMHLSAEGAAIARIMVDATLASETMQISRGDTIVLFTDGVTEAPREGNIDPEDVYGEERLAELVVSNRTREPEDLVGAIVDDVRKFAGGEFADDLTLVVVRAT